jgi:hypothetical protein
MHYESIDDCPLSDVIGNGILPPMPWFNMKSLTEADLKAMWAYLRSIPPVKNQVPFPIPPPAQANSSQK